MHEKTLVILFHFVLVR